jgi:hypothetical protein
MNQDYLFALKAFTEADELWQSELVKVYGKKAGDARYNPNLNGATDELKRLKDARREAMLHYELQNIRRRVANSK